MTDQPNRNDILSAIQVADVLGDADQVARLRAQLAALDAPPAAADPAPQPATDEGDPSKSPGQE